MVISFFHASKYVLISAVMWLYISGIALANHCASPLIHSPNGLCVPPSGSSSPTNFSEVVTLVVTIVSSLLALVVGVIVIIFLWRIVTAWFIGGGDQKEIERGRQSVVISIFVLVMVFSLWAIVSVVRRTFFG